MLTKGSTPKYSLSFATLSSVVKIRLNQLSHLGCSITDSLNLKNRAMQRHINISDFDYPLPDERIAKFPLSERDSSKLLVYRNGEISEAHAAVDAAVAALNGEALENYYWVDYVKVDANYFG